LIYLDTSVALAHLLGESHAPDPALWQERLVASRLLEYELWTRIHARRLSATHGEAVRELLATVALLELTPIVLARALEPFPVQVRTLDALHLASMLYLRERGEPMMLASYDERLVRAARALDLSIAL
jgi:predicted nucleic acid-binding protein